MFHTGKKPWLELSKKNEKWEIGKDEYSLLSWVIFLYSWKREMDLRKGVIKLLKIIKLIINLKLLLIIRLIIKNY